MESKDDHSKRTSIIDGEIPSRKPQIPEKKDEFFEKLIRGAQKLYGAKGGSADGQAGEAD